MRLKFSTLRVPSNHTDGPSEKLEMKTQIKKRDRGVSGYLLTNLINNLRGKINLLLNISTNFLVLPSVGTSIHNGLFRPILIPWIVFLKSISSNAWLPSGTTVQELLWNIPFLSIENKVMQDGATLEGYVASRRIRFDKFTHYAP